MVGSDAEWAPGEGKDFADCPGAETEHAGGEGYRPSDMKCVRLSRSWGADTARVEVMHSWMRQRRSWVMPNVVRHPPTRQAGRSLGRPVSDPGGVPGGDTLAPPPHRRSSLRIAVTYQSAIPYR